MRLPNILVLTTARRLAAGVVVCEGGQALFAAEACGALHGVHGGAAGNLAHGGVGGACGEGDCKGLHALPSNITRDDPAGKGITRDYTPFLLILQGITLLSF